MNNDDTPESNATSAMNWDYPQQRVVPTDFARHLERERNDLRAEVERLKESYRKAASDDFICGVIP